MANMRASSDLSSSGHMEGLLDLALAADSFRADAYAVGRLVRRFHDKVELGLGPDQVGLVLWCLGAALEQH